MIYNKIKNKISAAVVTIVTSIVFAVFLLTPGFLWADSRIKIDDNCSVLFKNGTLAIVKQGKKIWSKKVKNANSSAKGELFVHKMAGNLVAIHIKTKDKNGVNLEIVAIQKNNANKLQIIWNANSNFIGDIGERTFRTVRFDDLSGDGKPEIVTGIISEAVNLCGSKKSPLLFRQVYDPKTAKMRPIAAKRPSVLKFETIKGVVALKNDNQKSLIKYAAPSSVSAVAADGQNPLMLIPPYAIVDGDIKTAWIPGEGNVSGEFASFSIITPAYKVIKIGFRSMPDSKKLKSWQKLSSLILTTGKKNFQLVFPDEVKKDDFVWFEFSKPQKMECLSLIIEKIDSNNNKSVAISEMKIITEVDIEGGLERLASDLSNTTIGEQSLFALRQVGKDAADSVINTWSKLNQSGKKRAIRLLAEIAPAKSAALLAKAAVGADETLRTIAIDGLKKANDEGAIALAPFLKSKNFLQFEKTAKILSKLQSTKAMDALLLTAGKGDKDKRAIVRNQITFAALKFASHKQILIEKINSVNTANNVTKDNTRLLLDLLKAGALVKDLAAQVVSIASQKYLSSKDFANRYRLLEAISFADDESAVDYLADAAIDDDLFIRTLAIKGLSIHTKSDRAKESIKIALSDNAVQVRIEAVSGVKKSSIEKQVIDELKNIVSTDPWPVVKTVALSCVRSLPKKNAQEIVSVAINDDSRLVKLAALKYAAFLSGEIISKQIDNCLSGKQKDLEIVEAAAAAAGLRCQKTDNTSKLLFNVLQTGAEPLAVKSEINAAVAAAKALGSIGTPLAKQYLKKARTRSNPITDRAIDDALKQLGNYCTTPD